MNTVSKIHIHHVDLVERKKETRRGNRQNCGMAPILQTARVRRAKKITGIWPPRPKSQWRLLFYILALCRMALFIIFLKRQSLKEISEHLVLSGYHSRTFSFFNEMICTKQLIKHSFIIYVMYKYYIYVLYIFYVL